jgi:hypothetical protein
MFILGRVSMRRFRREKNFLPDIWRENSPTQHTATPGGAPSVSVLQRSDSFERKTPKLPKNAALAAGFALRVEVPIWIKSTRQGGSRI